MSAPHDPHGPEGTDDLELGADYEAFLADAQRALEPTAADATRVRAGLDAALSARATVPTEPTSQGVGGAGQAGVAAGGRGAASITVRWVGLAVLTLAVLGGLTLSLRDGAPADGASAGTGDETAGPTESETASGSAGAAPTGAATSSGASGEPARAGDAQDEAAAPSGLALEDPTSVGSGTASEGEGAASSRAASPSTLAGTPRARSRGALVGSSAGAGQDSTESGNPPANDEGASAERGSNVAGTADSAHTASGAAMPSEPSLLAREAARLLRARNALSAGRPSEALELTTRLPEGDPLGPERRAIRVRALCALGRTAEARQVAGTLGQGNGPSAAAVRASCVGEP